MTLAEKVIGLRMLLVVVVILGCNCLGYSAHACCPAYQSEQGNQLAGLCMADSLVQEMVEFLDPDTKLTKKRRKEFENRIKSFPHKIIHRDTTSYFLQTAYAVSYYEFSKKDYRKGLAYVKEFEANALPLEFMKSLWLYPSVGLNASSSLREKIGLKGKRDKNSWLTHLTYSYSDTIYPLKRTPKQFIDNFLDDIPVNGHPYSYFSILSLYKKLGGKLDWLNSFQRKGFFDKCDEANRSDIFTIIYSLWDVSAEDFEKNTCDGYIRFKTPPSNKVINLTSTEKFLASLTIEGKLNEIDSLIANGSSPSASIIALLDQCFIQNRFHLLIDYANQYEQFVREENQANFHNLYGLANLNLGMFEDAISHFDIGISLAPNKDVRSRINLNKAVALGELHRTDESVAIFFDERRNQLSAFDKFVWNDNLGYVYSLTDPALALPYYENAERYLDSSSLYDDRKVRHFCRKAHVLQSNPFLYREAVNKAMNYTTQLFASNMAKGMAFTEDGYFYNSMFDYATAIERFKSAYKCYEWLDAEDARICELNRNYASNLVDIGRYDEAIDILSRQLVLQDSIFGESSQQSFLTLQSLIPAYCKAADASYPALKNPYDRYCKIAANANFHINKYDDIKVRCDYLTYNGNHSEAIELLKETLKKGLASHQRMEIACCLEQLLRNHCDIVRYKSECSAIVKNLKKDIIKTLLVMTENERSAIQTPLQNLINGMITKGDISNAAELTIFKKGLLFATKRSVEKRLAKGSNAKDFQCLMKLRRSLNDVVAFGDTIHIPAIQIETLGLERKLNRKLISDKKLYSSLDRTKAQVAFKLNDSDIALDFVKYEIEGEPYLGVFVITKSESPRFVFIGIEKDVLENPTMIWKTLQPYLNCSSDIYFCPDGRMSTIGIEYEAVNDGIPANQKYRLHRVFHLADISKSETINKNIILIGVSDHNSPIGEGEKIDRGTFTDLPNVGYELKLIDNCLSRFTPRIIFNDDASEENIKKLEAENPSVLHFSTHGFFRSQTQLDSASQCIGHPDYNIARRALYAHKASLSGLVLRGGNSSWRMQEILEKEDDILTSDEVETLSFPNLDLTVLSACESGLGKIDEDGVWGLQRAFRIAGSKSLLCTLSTIPDYEAAFFMEQFYSLCAKGKTIYDSFQSAQKILYNEYTDSPKIWKSFILIE